MDHHSDYPDVTFVPGLQSTGSFVVTMAIELQRQDFGAAA